jgi:lysophospholipid acyltransferase 5
LSQAIALFFLAAWHGLHMGYYVCFFMELIVMLFEKDVS